MQILLIRHGIAEEVETSANVGSEDALRPLTKFGRRKMRRAARGLRQLVPELTLLATSPLLRAVQTGEIVNEQYRGTSAVQIAHLVPRKSMGGLLEWLQAQKPDAVIALVGHEPHLSVFAGWMLTGLQECFIELKKGAACFLDVPKDVKPGRAKLLWSLRPAHLRVMG